MELFTGQVVSAGDHLPWLPDEISKAESFLSCLESHEEVLRDWVRQRSEVSAQ